MRKNHFPVTLEAFHKGMLGTGTLRKILLLLDGNFQALRPGPCISITAKGCGTCGVSDSANFDTVGNRAILVRALLDGSHGGALPVP